MELKDKKMVEPTWGICVRIWWSFFWRCLVWGAIAGLFIATLMAALGRLLGLNAGLVGTCVLSIVFALIGIVVFKRILIKKYKTFEILLVQEEEKSMWKTEGET